MTVIRPNSVAGINSITVQSGNSLAVHKARWHVNTEHITGSIWSIYIFFSISVGSAYTTDNSAAKSINIGLGASISQHTDRYTNIRNCWRSSSKVSITQEGQFTDSRNWILSRQQIGAYLNASDSGAANMAVYRK